MGKKTRQARRVSGNPARAAEDRRVQQLRDLARTPPTAARRQGPTAADWSRLAEQALRAHPTCPDCGAPMAADSDAGEEGADEQGNWIISLWVSCTVYEADAAAGREPPPHPLSNDGLGFEHEMVVPT